MAAIEAGVLAGSDTRDAPRIARLAGWIERERVDASRFEFPMLPGVGEPLRAYVPSGGSGFRAAPA